MELEKWASSRAVYAHETRERNIPLLLHPSPLCSTRWFVYLCRLGSVHTRLDRGKSSIRIMVTRPFHSILPCQLNAFFPPLLSTLPSYIRIIDYTRWRMRPRRRRSSRFSKLVDSSWGGRKVEEKEKCGDKILFPRKFLNERGGG